MVDVAKYREGLDAGRTMFENAPELEGVADDDELRLWYQREIYALGTMAGGDESFDAGYFVGLRRAAYERGLCKRLCKHTGHHGPTRNGTSGSRAAPRARSGSHTATHGGTGRHGHRWIKCQIEDSAEAPSESSLARQG